MQISRIILMTSIGLTKLINFEKANFCRSRQCCQMAVLPAGMAGLKIGRREKIPWRRDPPAGGFWSREKKK